MPSYVPSRLDDYEAFVRNLATKLEPNPGFYGVNDNAIAPFIEAYGTFATAYALAQDPETRTKPTIAAEAQRPGVVCVCPGVKGPLAGARGGAAGGDRTGLRWEV